MNDEDEAFAREVGAKVARKLHTRRATKQEVWLGLGVAGLIGWSVAVPTILGAMLGMYWDRHHPGARSWTLMLLVAGLVLGCANAWRWVQAQNGEINSRDDDPDA